MTITASDVSNVISQIYLYSVQDIQQNVSSLQEISIDCSGQAESTCIECQTKTKAAFIKNNTPITDDIIKDINSPITFWLDSHWSGTPDVGCDNQTLCPVLQELYQINQHPIKTHTIMIDDIRLMNLSLNRYEGFPVSLEQITDSIYNINPEYKIKYYDDYTSKNDVLVAYI